MATWLDRRIDAEIEKHLKAKRLAENCRNDAQRAALLARAAAHDAKAQRLMERRDALQAEAVSNAVKAARGEGGRCAPRLGCDGLQRVRGAPGFVVQAADGDVVLNVRNAAAIRAVAATNAKRAKARTRKG